MLPSKKLDKLSVPKMGFLLNIVLYESSPLAALLQFDDGTTRSRSLLILSSIMALLNGTCFTSLRNFGFSTFFFLNREFDRNSSTGF